MAHGGTRPGAGRPKLAGRAAALSPREARFVDFYLIDLNGAKAAQMAGYAEGSARVAASRLLTRDNIRAEIQKRMQALAAKAGLSAEHVVDELKRIAFSDIRRAITWRSNVTKTAHDEETGEETSTVVNEVVLTDSDKLDDATAASISSISQGPRGELRIKLHDKRAALVDLGKHLGLFRPDAGDGEGLVVEIRRLSSKPDGGANDAG